MAEGRNQMDHFAKIASEQRKKLAAAVTIDFKVEDSAGNRVVLSTDGSITGYTNGKRTPWEPILNEHQISMMESGQGTRVAADLLKDYSSFAKTALLDVKMRDGSRENLLEEVIFVLTANIIILIIIIVVPKYIIVDIHRLLLRHCIRLL